MGGRGGGGRLCGLMVNGWTWHRIIGKNEKNLLEVCLKSKIGQRKRKLYTSSICRNKLLRLIFLGKRLHFE